MAPQLYIQKRESGEEVAFIDDRPYFPQLHVDVTNKSSIQKAAALIMHSTVEFEKLQVEQITGGITNTLFKVSGLKSPQEEDDAENACLVRVFGAEGMIDRDVENSTYACLSSQKLAPPYHGRFANGRIEGWKDNMRALTVRELSKPYISKLIAVSMAKLHSEFQIPDHLQDYYQEPSMWNQLQSWYEQALQATFRSEKDTQRAQLLSLSNLQVELEWLKSICPINAAVVFCHNDVLAANILYDGQQQSIQLIDFEYGGMNYRSFDIANHLNEYAGGTDTGIPNYEWLPTTDDMKRFIQTYLTTANGTTTTTSDSIQETLEEVQVFVLANHLYWGLWAVNQAATEGCQDFDYLLYATNRLRQYQVCKVEWQQRHT